MSTFTIKDHKAKRIKVSLSHTTTRTGSGCKNVLIKGAKVEQISYNACKILHL